MSERTTIDEFFTAAMLALHQFVGPYGRLETWLGKSYKIPRFQIRCKRPECNWTSASDGLVRGQGSSSGFALDLWANHLRTKHDAACPWSEHPERGRTLRAHRDQQHAISHGSDTPR
jgi:hypothetical protein